MFQLTDTFDDEYLTSAMLEFGDMDRDGLLDSDEIFRFYLAVVRFPMKKASDTAQSFLDLGDSNKDGKLSLRGNDHPHNDPACQCYSDLVSKWLIACLLFNVSFENITVKGGKIETFAGCS